MRCLDTAGGIISGTLEVQSGLYITSKYDKNEKRYITGKLGVGTKEPVARLHVQSPTPISAEGKISSQGSTVTGSGETFERLGIGDAIIIRDSLDEIQTKIVTSPPINFEGKSLEIDKPFDSDLKNVDFGYRLASERTLNIVHFVDRDQTIQFLVNADGNVGIGIDPDNDAKLNLGGTLKLTNNDQTAAVSLQTDKTNSENWLQFTATNLTGYSFDQQLKARQGVVTNRIENYNDESLILKTSGEERIAITYDTGNIGIGISLPVQQLVVVEKGKVGIGYNQPNQSATLAVNGNVGIGTPQPEAQLHVVGTVQVETTQDAITLGLTQSTQSVNIGFQDSQLNFTSRELEGYSFDQPITAQQGVVLGGALKLTNNDNNQTAEVSFQIHKIGRDNWVQFTASSLVGYSFDQTITAQKGVVTNRIGNQDKNQSLVLQTNDQDRIAITSDGKISIGDTGTKNAQLQLNGTFQVEAAQNALAVSLTPNNEADFGSALQLARNTQSVNLGFQNQNFVLRTNNQDRITIARDGKVGIGVPNSPSQLDINGTAKATLLEGNFLKLKDLTIDQFSNETNLTDNEKSVPTEKAVKTYVDIEINGLKTDLKAFNEEITQVKTTLADKAAQKGNLEVDFNVKSLNVETSIYAKQLATETINSNRVLTREAVSNGFYQISSRALKEEINDLSSQEVSAILKTLNPVKFIYTEDESKTPQAGFIAEDTPDLLTANDKQAIKVVDIVAILTKVAQDHRKTLSDVVKIVKKQQAEIVALTQKIKEMEEKTDP
ncbi:tail fiber domain-containing protein [Leptolyngbya sp. FACHB-671]|nr:tail fiber domain-containing protein [Leptolyngbya sp. FACHB-671]